MNTIKISAALKRHIAGAKFTVNHSVPNGKYLIMYIANGRGKLLSDKAEHRITDGDFIFLKSGGTFSFRLVDKYDALVYYVEFQADGDIDFENDFSLSIGLHHCYNAEEVEPLFEKLIQSFIRKAYLREAVSSAILCQLLCSIASSQKENNCVENQIYALLHDIHENFISDDIDVEKYANEAGLSKDRFSVIFKEYFKYPPYKYQLILKIREATYLLTHTDLPISEISKILGFSSPLYFSSSYKKQTGISPTEARKACR